MRPELFDQALKEASDLRKAIVGSTINEVVERMTPKVESLLNKKLRESESLYPSGYHNMDVEDSTATDNPESYDDLSELGDGDAVTESGFGDEFASEEIFGEEEENFEDDEFNPTQNLFKDQPTEGADLNIDLQDETFENAEEDEAFESLGMEIEEAFGMYEEEGEDIEEPAPAPKKKHDAAPAPTTDFEIDLDDEEPAEVEPKKSQVQEMARKYENALRENISLKKKLRSVKVENANLNDGVGKLVKANGLLKSALKESELRKTQIVLANKFLNTRKVDTKLREKFISELAKSKTINESKFVYEKYRKGTKIRDNKVAKLNEQASPVKRTSEMNVDVERFRKLAGN